MGQNNTQFPRGDATFRGWVRRGVWRGSPHRQMKEFQQGSQKLVSSLHKQNHLGPAFGRTDFSRIFIFEPPDFFADFLAGFFSSFCGKKCPEKSSRKIPGKILQNLYNKNPPTHFCRLPRAKFRKEQGT